MEFDIEVLLRILMWVI